jgi:hypothetical protein
MCRPGELQNGEYLHWIRLFSLLRFGFVFVNLPRLGGARSRLSTLTFMSMIVILRSLLRWKNAAVSLGSGAFVSWLVAAAGLHSSDIYIDILFCSLTIAGRLFVLLLARLSLDHVVNPYIGFFG